MSTTYTKKYRIESIRTSKRRAQPEQDIYVVYDLATGERLATLYSKEFMQALLWSEMKFPTIQVDFKEDEQFSAYKTLLSFIELARTESTGEVVS